MKDFAVIEARRRSRERRRTFAAWAVFGVVSVGLHHLALQGLDVAGMGRRNAERQTVLLDLFQPPPPELRPAPPTPPPRPTEPPRATQPAPQSPQAQPQPPNTPESTKVRTARSDRPPRPRVPRVPRATPQDEERPEQMTLHSDYGDPYDPLNPHLRMRDWSDDQFAAAERYFDATDADRERGLGPEPLRSPFEQIGPWSDWGGDAAIAAANDFFGETSDAIQLAINPERPDLLRYVPVDATVLAYLNLRAIHGGPHAAGVEALLRTLPDYQTMVGNIEADLLETADELYVTSSNPADRSKTVVIVRHRLTDEQIAALVGRQISLAGGKPDWSRLSQRSAVTVDRDHADVTPWLYLFPEPGVVLVVHRSNVAPVVAALEGRAGLGEQPQLVYQIRRLMGEPEQDEPQPEAQPEEPPTLFAVADAGALGPHLRFFTRFLAGTDAGELGGGYLRVTGGERPEVLGGLRLAAPEQVPRWQELMRRIEGQDMARTFGFAWAGRDDRVFFRFGLTDPMVNSSLGLFRTLADRYYTSESLPQLPTAPSLPGNVITTVVQHGDADAGDVPLGPDGERIKDEPEAGPGRPKYDADAGGVDGSQSTVDSPAEADGGAG